MNYDEILQHKKQFEKSVLKLQNNGWDIFCIKGTFIIKKVYRTLKTYTEFGVIDIAKNL